MSAHSKKAILLARQLFKMSLENGVVSPERVSGVLEYIEKHRPANPVMVLKAYRRLIATELARSEAVGRARRRDRRRRPAVARRRADGKIPPPRHRHRRRQSGAGGRAARPRGRRRL